MSIDPAIVQHVAELAKLELDEHERDALARQLARIVTFVAQLEEVDVSDVAPTKDIAARHNVERADEPQPCLPRDEALAAAPDTDDGHFLVPKVLPD